MLHNADKMLIFSFSPPSLSLCNVFPLLCFFSILCFKLLTPMKTIVDVVLQVNHTLVFLKIYSSQENNFGQTCLIIHCNPRGMHNVVYFSLNSYCLFFFLLLLPEIPIMFSLLIPEIFVFFPFFFLLFSLSKCIMIFLSFISTK